ncbi:hypothetical protein LEP1GSC188_3121 [Leptospira weilii serovar Topaz str. LT2116]|uniref:Uncharacterized protein n=1 Tax=Leptospira weilii serovar Topaz str. LT2116 TaxID=1088540 RepID=M3G4I6_9LEPT|nr:hypothetical protein LEP1GSC188_3121 [Leptospira weilii serovar Topaz str. LT2116]
MRLDFDPVFYLFLKKRNKIQPVLYLFSTCSIPMIHQKTKKLARYAKIHT